MGFESILVSKGLPHAEFSEKCVIDAHRSITSHNDVRHLTSGAIRSSRGEFGRLCLYTRERLPRSGFVLNGHLGSDSRALEDADQSRDPCL